MTSYLLSGPASEPVTLDEARAYLRLDATDDDALVTTLIAAARLHIESVTGRALLSQTWRVVRDDWPVSAAIRLPVSPLRSVAAVTGYDAEGTAHNLDPDAIQLDVAGGQLFLPAGYGDGMLLRDRQGIEIDYVAGYGDDAADVPEVLCQALLQPVAYWFENRDSVVIAGAGALIPSGFDQLVAPYRAVRL
jgi:uncharacterized phiE125 gp8 family phage protein